MEDNKKMNSMIVEQNYWNNSYENYKFRRLQTTDPTRQLIEKYVPRAKKNNNAFELGCFPGRFLVELGQKGYILNGCDLTPRIITDLKNWCLENECIVDNFYNESYLRFIDNKYDLVASFGFIEHFQNYQELFLQQCQMVKEEGILIVQFPNFKGTIQYLLHKFFDLDNLSNHIIPSMNLYQYEKLLPKEFEIIYCGYYGNFDFWIDDYKKQNGRFKNKLLSLFFKTSKLWKFIPNSSFYSPYVAIIAKRRKKG